MQIRIVQSRIGAALLLLPTSLIGPTLLWETGVDEGLVLAIGSCFAFASAVLLLSLLGEKRTRRDLAMQLDVLVRWSLTLLFALIPWFALDEATSVTNNLLVFFAITVHTAVSHEFVGRRKRMLGPFIIAQLSYVAAFTSVGAPAMAGLTMLWAATSIPAYALRSHSEQAVLDLVEDHRRSARIDQLTGLANRAALTEGLRLAADSGVSGHLVAFDLDDFKVVNDTFGHAAGDAVLTAVARRLRTSLPERATVARLGGDEFVVWIPSDPHESNELARVTDRIVAAVAHLGDPIVHGTQTLRTSASAGITAVTAGGDLDRFLHEADMAMYWSKGSNEKVTVFDQQMREDAVRRVADEQRFREAIGTGAITFWGQPLVSMTDGTGRGVELLARWPQPDGTIWHAASFIHLARETGLEVELGRQALLAASDLLERWSEDPALRHLEVNINMSAKHLGRGLLDDVNRVVRGLREPSRLGLEFGESELIDESREVFTELAQIRTAGPRILIDDFGVGYSSLTYLRTLPLSGIKVDPSFVSEIHGDPTKLAVTSAIVQLADALDLSVTAEGVTRREELRTLHDLGIETGQGNLFAASAPLPECTARLLQPFERPPRIRHAA